MEDEAYVQSFYTAWIFFPIFILIAVGQGLLIELYNKKYHPFNIILEGATKKGKMLFTCINANQRSTLRCLKFILPNKILDRKLFQKLIKRVGPNNQEDRNFPQIY